MLNYFLVLGSSLCCPTQLLHQKTDGKFEQKTDRFWEFDESSNSWVEVELPLDLFSCVNGNCTKVGSVQGREFAVAEKENLKGKESEENWNMNLPIRKRISLTKMSETSIWVTGVSGSIYERFWNGVQWVIAPHDLPVSAGRAISVFIVNQTILALSESGNLYQMQLSESSQPIWLEFAPPSYTTKKEEEQNSPTQITSGVVSHDGERIYFCTKNGSLLELTEVEPPRWENHGRPPGGNVAAIADAATIRPEVILTISSTGDLYEYDKSSRPSWKKHIWTEGSRKDASLMASRGCSIYGVGGAHSISLFLLTKGGDLVERRLHQRKWKWIVHGSPVDHQLTSITPVLEDEWNERFFSLFLTTAIGSVFQYRCLKYPGIDQEKDNQETWVSHEHPLHARAARNIAGLQIQAGRILFALDDGRLAELHLQGLGGDNTGPAHQVNTRKKSTLKYMWSTLDAPESEGWNAEYCMEQRGPTNCMMGIKDKPFDVGLTRSMTRRKGGQAVQTYMSLDSSSGINTMEEYVYPKNWINNNFRLRVMHGGKSFFLITEEGLIFEYVFNENVWLWLRHEHTTAMSGALGNYNGSLFLVDTQGSLFIRERHANGLIWINCTSMRKGKNIIGGRPWDGAVGRLQKLTTEDSLFFISKNGRLLQFTVALRKFKWKDCKNPTNAKLASIVDQEVFRENIVFVIGRNGRLYQYNKVTELWHEHYQSQHLILSRLPGTVMRRSPSSLTGSIFMVSEDGGLVEYQWSSLEGWNWVEHGTPSKSVVLAGPPGPCLEGSQLFFIGSDGEVYLRYLDQSTWKWNSFGFPYVDNVVAENERQVAEKDEGNVNYYSNKDCDSKVASIRPIPFSEYSVIFELRDGRLAEMQQVEETQWIWSRIIGTPTSLCIASYWTSIAS